MAKAVNREDKRTRRVRDRVFVKFERSRRYRDRNRCQEKKSRRARARDSVFRDPPTPRTSPRSLFADRDPPPRSVFWSMVTLANTGYRYQCHTPFFEVWRNSV